MHKFEKIIQIDSIALNDFLKAVNYSKFHLFPNATSDAIHNYLFELINNSFNNSIVYSYSINQELIAIVTLRVSEWDSNHFGYKCASIENVFYKFSVNAKELSLSLNKMFYEIEKDAILTNIKFMSVSINSTDTVVSSALQSTNFKYILTWVDGIYNSKEKIQIANPNCEIGIIKESEIDYYKELASKYYFKGGRFYLDTNFESTLVDSMYSNLVASSYSNNDIMLSCRINDRPVGLFVCKKVVHYSHFQDLRVAPLRYLVVDPDKRKKNVGFELFAETINYLVDKSDIITTGLEVHNLPSLNLHSKLNFKINYTHNVFHWRLT